jgi:alcohol dehydrogenase (NADP+)
MFITSKLWNDSHGEEEVLPACRRSLDDLRLDALDMYLVHWPFPNHHPPGCDVDARNPRARPYVHAEYMRTWRQMERLVKMGLVRHIGTSNMTIPKLELLLRDAEIRPACNQMELHPHMQQPELFAFLLQQGIVPVGYSPVGSPNRPARDVTPADTVDTEDPVIRAIAERLGVHPAVVCIKWAEQRGQVPIPFSVKRNQQLASLKAVVAEPLNPADMEALAGIDRNCRLIKGQVFLWEGASGWEDLWDIDGAVAEG